MYAATVLLEPTTVAPATLDGLKLALTGLNGTLVDAVCFERMVLVRGTFDANTLVVCVLFVVEFRVILIGLLASEERFDVIVTVGPVLAELFLIADILKL